MFSKMFLRFLKKVQFFQSTEQYGCIFVSGDCKLILSMFFNKFHIKIM